MDAYEVILAPGGTGSATPVDSTWLHSYLAAQATMTGTGWNINTEGTPSNLGGFATAGEQDVGGLRTGSSTVITFKVDVPQTGDYHLSVFDGSNSAASDVSGPTNIFVRADGGSPQEVWLPVGYNWVIWNHGDTTLHLTAGTHQISLSTTGANGDQRRRDHQQDRSSARRPGGPGLHQLRGRAGQPGWRDHRVPAARPVGRRRRRHAPRPARDFLGLLRRGWLLRSGLPVPAPTG
jgi:hypothetical protein